MGAPLDFMKENDRIVFNRDFFLVLRERLKALLHDNEADSFRKDNLPLIDRFTCEIDTPDIISMVACFQSKIKVFLQSRDDSFSALALGSIYQIRQNLLEDVQAFLKNSGYYDLKFYGAIPFEAPQSLKGKWRGFRKIHFFLPRFEFVQRTEGCFLNIYFLPQKIQALWSDFDQLEKLFRFERRQGVETASVSVKKQTPNLAKWVKLVNVVQKNIKKGFIDKLVLARSIETRSNQDIQADCLLQELSGHFKENYIFFFQNGIHSFLSFSPEKLFKVKNDIVTAEAIAGSSCERPFDERIQTLVKKHPLMDLKNITEQEIVEKEIMAHMKKISSEFHLEQRKKVLDLGYIRHIKSTFNAVMKKFYDFAELLDLFHPTSAVCGSPKGKAKKLIAKLEQFQRGLYAAPCGFFSALEAEFLVGIRSILIRGRTVYFFSGAGILSDSLPDLEWEELNTKLSPFKSFFQFDEP